MEESIRAKANRVAKAYYQDKRGGSNYVEDTPKKPQPPVRSVGRNGGGDDQNRSDQSGSSSSNNNSNGFVNSSVNSSISDPEYGTSSGSGTESDNGKSPPTSKEESEESRPAQQSAESFSSKAKVQLHDSQRSARPVKKPKHESKDARRSGAAMISFTIPCPAHDMSADYPNTVANFKISSQTRHGDGLECSDKKCRESGIKFRYCDVCKGAIVRKNFRAQHNHDAHSVSSTATSGKGKRRRSSDNTKFIKKAAAPSAVTSYSTSSTTLSNEQPKSDRTQIWNDLLNRRPDDGDDEQISKWLLDVMAASDPRKRNP